MVKIWIIIKLYKYTLLNMYLLCFLTYLKTVEAAVATYIFVACHKSLKTSN